LNAILSVSNQKNQERADRYHAKFINEQELLVDARRQLATSKERLADQLTTIGKQLGVLRKDPRDHPGASARLVGNLEVKLTTSEKKVEYYKKKKAELAQTIHRLQNNITELNNDILDITSEADEWKTRVEQLEQGARGRTQSRTSPHYTRANASSASRIREEELEQADNQDANAGNMGPPPLPRARPQSATRQSPTR
jgi:chromosome segregation ATPase